MMKILNDLKIKIMIEEDNRIYLLARIFLWRDSSGKSQWEQGLFSSLNNVSLLKNTHKYPTEEWLLSALCDSWDDVYFEKGRVENLVENAWEPSLIIPESFNKQNLYNFLKDYHSWLAYLLSTNGVVTRQQVKDEIELLLDKYPIGKDC